MAPRQWLYTLDHRPPAVVGVVLGLQWAVVVLPAVVVLGEMIAEAAGVHTAARAGLVGRIMLVAAAVQIAQVLAGHRLPAVVGPSAALLVGVLASAERGLGVVGGSMAVAGIAVVALGLSRAGRWIGRLYTPAVVSATLMLIAVSLSPMVVKMVYAPAGAGSSAGGMVFAVVLAMVMVGLQVRVGGVAGGMVLLGGMITGSVGWYALGMGRWEGWPRITGGIDWLWQTMPVPEVDWAVAGAFVLCYMAMVANELGTLEALGALLEPGDLEGRVARAMVVGGLGGVLGGLAGALGMVSYGVSPAMVLASRCASRWPLMGSAAVVAALGLWPGAMAVVALVPGQVTAAVVMALVAQTMVAAMNVLERLEAHLRWRGALVVGGAVATGLVVGFMPPGVRDSISPLLRPVLANGFVMGLGAAMALEHLVLGRGR